jgi:hypothetical protein
LAELVAAAYSLLFAAALLGKLDSWRSWSEAVAAFVPRRPRAVAVVRFGAPLAEGAVVVLALSLPKIGLVAAGALLVVFAVAVVLLRPAHAGRECNCFGSIAPSQISLSLAARNGALAGTAFAVAIGVWNLRVSRLSPSQMLVLLLVGSLLLVCAEFRRFSRVEQRSSKA